MSPQQGQSEGCGYPDLDHQAVTLVAYGMGDLIQETGHRYGDTNAAKGTVAAQEHDGSHGNCDQQPGGPQLFLGPLRPIFQIQPKKFPQGIRGIWSGEVPGECVLKCFARPRPGKQSGGGRQRDSTSRCETKQHEHGVRDR
jgi:hypothetical protein